MEGLDNSEESISMDFQGSPDAVNPLDGLRSFAAKKDEAAQHSAANEDTNDNKGGTGNSDESGSNQSGSDSADNSDGDSGGADSGDSQDSGSEGGDDSGSGDDQTAASTLRAIAEHIGYSDDFEFPENPDDEDIDIAVNYFKHAKTKAVEDGITEFLESDPDVAALVRHKKEGKSINTFLRKVQQDELETTTFGENDAAVQEQIVRAELKGKLDDDVIDIVVQNAKDEGKLFEKAKGIQEKIKARRLEQAQQAEEQEAQQVAAQRQQAEQTMNNINSLIESGKLGSFTLPESDKQQFQNFLFGVDEDGVPVRQKAWAAMPLEKKMLVDYIVSKDFKVKGLNMSAVEQKQKLAGLNKQNRQEGHRTIKKGADSTKKSNDFSLLRKSFGSTGGFNI